MTESTPETIDLIRKMFLRGITLETLINVTSIGAVESAIRGLIPREKLAHTKVINRGLQAHIVKHLATHSGAIPLGDLRRRFPSPESSFTTAVDRLRVKGYIIVNEGRDCSVTNLGMEYAALLGNRSYIKGLSK